MGLLKVLKNIDHIFIEYRLALVAVCTLANNNLYLGVFLPDQLFLKYGIVAYQQLMDKLNTIKDRFFRNIKVLKSFSKTEYRPLTDNPKLRCASNIINLPVVFKPYKRYIEDTLQTEVNLDLSITIDDVRAKDEEILGSFKQPNFNFSKINLDRMIDSIVTTFSEMNCVNQPHEFLDILESLSRLPKNTSAGYPFYGKKSDEFNILDASKFVLDQVSNPNLEALMINPCTIYHRYSVSLSTDYKTNKVKSRIVWGFPFRITLLESTAFGSMVASSNNWSRTRSNHITGTAKTREGISTDIIRNLRSHKEDILSLDFSSFDSTVPSWFWALFYSTYCTFNNFSELELRTLDNLMCYHCNTPYCIRDTKLKYNGKGVPSGSFITALADTVFNRMMVNYGTLEKTKGAYYAGDTAAIMGDDNGIALKYLTPDYLYGLYRRVGLVVNTDKTKITKWDEPFDLFGLTWNTEDAPVRGLHWYVSHLCVPKKFYRDLPMPVAEFQTYRAISIVAGLFDGFKTLCKLMNGQDYVLNNLLSQYNKGEDPIICYISGDEKKNYQKIPLSNVIEIGWKAF
jgi:hypothetical protein